MGKRTGMALAAALALALAGDSVAAQDRESWDRPAHDRYHRHQEPRGSVGFNLVIAQATGEFRRAIDVGFGGEVNGVLRLDPEGVVNLRADAGFIVYGHEDFRVCSPVSCRVDLDLTTTNNIFYVGAGPEIAYPGAWARPYAFGTLGLGYFATISSLGGSHGHDDFASTENFGDAVFQSRIGGGVQLKVGGGRSPVYLDFGAEYQVNGQARYLREGDIIDHPDGSISFRPRRSEANLVSYRVGVSIALPRPDDHDDDRGRRRTRRR